MTNTFQESSNSDLSLKKKYWNHCQHCSEDPDCTVLLFVDQVSPWQGHFTVYRGEQSSLERIMGDLHFQSSNKRPLWGDMCIILWGHKKVLPFQVNVIHTLCPNFNWGCTMCEPARQGPMQLAFILGIWTLACMPCMAHWLGYCTHILIQQTRHNSSMWLLLSMTSMSNNWLLLGNQLISYW